MQLNMLQAHHTESYNDLFEQLQPIVDIEDVKRRKYDGDGAARFKAMVQYNRGFASNKSNKGN